MLRPSPIATRDVQPTLYAGIFDVDGVLLASPHEQAWRDALAGYADPVSFTTDVYQVEVAGKPRLEGARAALKAMGVADPDGKAFPDALRFVQAVHDLGWPMAVASSSKNANAMMKPIRLPSGDSLLGAFSANVCGRDMAHGKPDPELFLLAASELHIAAQHCFVAEDAPAGIEAARAGRMTGLGVARLGDSDLLREAHADLVVTSLDDVALVELAAGRLCRSAA